MIVAQRGLGDIWSTLANGAVGFVKGIMGSGTTTLTVPPECATFDFAAQIQCAQMAQQAAKGQIPPTAYAQWVQQQQTWQTVKKYAPYAGLALGAIVVISLLKK